MQSQSRSQKTSGTRTPRKADPRSDKRIPLRNHSFSSAHRLNRLEYLKMATVLIADDSMFMRKRLNDILTEDGHSVIGEAEDGEEAIQMYARLQPELVMLDITMPERNGMGALNHIMSTSPEAKVIMCSAL